MRQAKVQQKKQNVAKKKARRNGEGDFGEISSWEKKKDAKKHGRPVMESAGSGGGGGLAARDALAQAAPARAVSCATPAPVAPVGLARAAASTREPAPGGDLGSAFGGDDGAFESPGGDPGGAGLNFSPGGSPGGSPGLGLGSSPGGSLGLDLASSLAGACGIHKKALGVAVSTKRPARMDLVGQSANVSARKRLAFYRGCCLVTVHVFRPQN